MSNAAVLKEFDWVGELEHTVVYALTKSFGLDPLLFEDKIGGNVDTVHNVRKGIWATEEEKNNYQNRGDYDSDEYHSHANYVKNNKKNSELKKAGNLDDGYTGERVSANANMDLDHIVAAHQLHNDAGRVLAEVDGKDLANRDSNLVPTNRAINRAKKTDDMDTFLSKIPEKINNKQKEINKCKEKLSRLDKNNPADRNKIEKLNKQIKNGENYIKKHKKIDPKLAEKRANKAKKEIEREINKAYYSSKKFIRNTGFQAGKQGLLMGGRQALGLVLAELWFELRKQVPRIYQECSNNFTLEKFFSEVSKTIVNIWERLKKRFKDLIIAFRDGMLGGIMSSLTTTLQNIFITSSKRMGKMIREVWNSLVGVIKLIFFNPKNLQPGELVKEALRLLSFGVSALIGIILNEYLENTLKAFPLVGEPIAAFVSALVTGIINLGFVYFLEHSEIARKVWDFLNQFGVDTHQARLAKMNEINAELDCYLVELGKIEFNISSQELSDFSNQLVNANSEQERSNVLDKEIKRRGIDLPFDPNDDNSLLEFINNCKKSYSNG